MYRKTHGYTCHLELTDKCNAECPMCQRTGASYLADKDLSLSEIKSIFSVDTLQHLNRVVACGSFGDPMMARDVYEITEYFINAHPLLRVVFSTNGSLRDEDWWFKFGGLSRNQLVVMFCMDGTTQETHEMYRRNTSLDKILRNAEAYISSGAVASWQFLPYKHSEHEVEQAKELSLKMGFKQFEIVKTSRFAGQDNWQYEYDGKDYVLEPSPEYMNPNWDNEDSKINCKVQNVPEFYLDCEGYVVPCCYLGSPMYRGRRNLKHDDRWVKEAYTLWDGYNMDDFSALKHNVFDILNHKWFHNLEKMWDTNEPSICNQTCGNQKMSVIRLSL